MSLSLTARPSHLQQSSPLRSPPDVKRKKAALHKGLCEMNYCIMVCVMIAMSLVAVTLCRGISPTFHYNKHIYFSLIILGLLK